MRSHEAFDLHGGSMEFLICTMYVSRTVEWHFKSCARASSLSSIDPRNSTIPKGSNGLAILILILGLSVVASPNS